jgi:streptogramin lyase
LQAIPARNSRSGIFVRTCHQPIIFGYLASSRRQCYGEVSSFGSRLEKSFDQEYNFPRNGEATMDLSKLCLFALSATLAASPTAGRLNVQIQEYEVPTPKSRPHDPALAPDGSLWYTGQGANKLGRLDPKTGQFKEYPLKTPNSGPHGLVADKDGNIWFTAISGGYVGKLNPETGEITEYRPDKGTEIDPHTPVFDHDGILWFTNERPTTSGASIRRPAR